MSETKEEERVDLSHYDLKDRFSRHEAACLIAGIDPYQCDQGDLRGTVEWARMLATDGALEEGCITANAQLQVLFDNKIAANYSSPPWHDGSGAGGGASLPSIWHWSLFIDYCNKHSYPADVSGAIDFQRLSFYRKDIVSWLQAKGYAGAQYFLSRREQADNPQQAEIDHLHAEVARLQSELAQAKASQPQAMPIPEYLDPSHSRYSYRLAAAVRAWEAVSESGNRGVKAAIESWLRDHAEELGLVYQGKPSDKAIKEVATVANWNTAGGAPKTC